MEVSGDISLDASIAIYLVGKATVHTKGNKDCSTLLASITYQPSKSDNREETERKAPRSFKFRSLWKKHNHLISWHMTKGTVATLLVKRPGVIYKFKFKILKE